MKRSTPLSPLLLAVIGLAACVQCTATTYTPLTLGTSVSQPRVSSSSQYFYYTITLESEAALTVTMDNWINSASVYIKFALNAPVTSINYDERADSDFSSSEQLYTATLPAGPITIGVRTSSGFSIVVAKQLSTVAKIAIGIGAFVAVVLTLTAIGCRSIKKAVSTDTLLRYRSFRLFIIGGLFMLIGGVMIIVNLSIGITYFMVLLIMGSIWFTIGCLMAGPRILELDGVKKTVTVYKYFFLVIPCGCGPTYQMADINNFTYTYVRTRRGRSTRNVSIQMRSGAVPALIIAPADRDLAAQCNTFIRRNTPEVARPAPSTNNGLNALVAGMIGAANPMLAAMSGQAMASPVMQPIPVAGAPAPMMMPPVGGAGSAAAQQAAIQAQIAQLQQQQALLAAQQRAGGVPMAAYAPPAGGPGYPAGAPMASPYPAAGATPGGSVAVPMAYPAATAVPYAPSGGEMPPPGMNGKGPAPGPGGAGGKGVML